MDQDAAVAGGHHKQQQQPMSLMTIDAGARRWPSGAKQAESDLLTLRILEDSERKMQLIRQLLTPEQYNSLSSDLFANPRDFVSSTQRFVASLTSSGCGRGISFRMLISLSGLSMLLLRPAPIRLTRWLVEIRPRHQSSSLSSQATIVECLHGNGNGRLQSANQQIGKTRAS